MQGAGCTGLSSLAPCTLRPAPIFAAVLVVIAGCQARQAGIEPIFVEGRPVTMAGDARFAMTLSGRPGLLVRDRASGRVATLAADVLHSPRHVQWVGNDWYVSDVDNGKPEIVVLGLEGAFKQRIPLGQFTDTPHQFAVLPGGRLIVEGRGGKLLELTNGKVSTFAATDPASKTGLLVAVAGGVLHAVPGKHITLYNEFGHVRWQLDWPWAETAFISDVAVDYNTRIHVIAGVPSNGTFVVYTLSPQTGEVVRWSIPGPKATFTVDPLGNLKPGEAKEWTGA